MSPIIDRQRRLAEIGRIRMGEKKLSQRGKQYPAALQAWRLTSRVRDRLDAAARIYGGTVRPWQEEPGQFELYTESDALDVMLAPGEPVTQWFEHWDKPAGVQKARVTCLRRCDGVTETLSDQPCLCAGLDERVCKTTTRLSVLLYRVPGLGVWRLDSRGEYAATELAGTAEFLAGLGDRLPVILRLDPRESVDGQGETHKFVVPVLDVAIAVPELVAGYAPPLAPPAAPALEQPGYRPLPPGEGTSVAGALESVQGDPPPRRRTARPQAELGPAAPPPAAAPIGVPDDPDDRGAPTAPAAEQPTEPAAKPITEAQVKRLWTIARGKTMPETEIRRLVHEITGQDSTRAIPKGPLYDAVIAAIEAWDALDVLPKESAPAVAGSDQPPFADVESIPFGDPAPTPEA